MQRLTVHAETALQGRIAAVRGGSLMVSLWGIWVAWVLYDLYESCVPYAPYDPYRPTANPSPDSIGFPRAWDMVLA